MGQESDYTNVEDLNELWPLDSDKRYNAPIHLRGIKLAVQNSIKRMLGGIAATEVAIATGILTTTLANIIVASESSTADDLDSIAATNLEDGSVLLLKPKTGHTITLKHLTGTLELAGEVDLALSAVDEHIALIYDLAGTKWIELSRSVTLATDADTLGGQAGSYYLDLDNATNQLATAQIEDSAITTGKINALAVTNAKVAVDAVDSTEIVNNAVTLAKLAQMATASFMGRDTAATGNVEVLSAALARGILNVEDGSTADQNAAEIIALLAFGIDTSELVAGAVTLAKMADMATNSFLGRDTAGTGAPEVLTAAQVRTILNVASVDIPAPEDLTLASGVVVPVRNYAKILAESGTVDDLINLDATALPDGAVVMIKPDTGDTITVKHASGILELKDSEDLVLSADEHTLTLLYSLTDTCWYEIARSFEEKVGFSAYLSADVTATGSLTTWTEEYDVGGNFATGQFTTPVAGRYRIELLLLVYDIVAANSVQESIIDVGLAGPTGKQSRISLVNPTGGSTTIWGTHTISIEVDVAVGFIIDIRNATSGITLEGTGATTSHFSITLVSRS